MAVKTYTTRQGDTFEKIAWNQMGSSESMCDIIRANRQYMDVAVFEAGVELVIPEVVKRPIIIENTPPWRR